MCITSKSAKLVGTKILSFKKDNGNIFLSYSNSVQNLANGKNCMILPIPGTLKEEWFYNTKEYSDFMSFISARTIVSEDLNYGIRSRGMFLGAHSRSLSRVQVGMYEVHYSNVMSDLNQLSQELGIVVKDSLLNFFTTHYSNFGFICCVFDSREKMDSQPIALEYKPLDENTLFYPTMDGHDGDIPTKSFVEVDHMIVGPVKNKVIDLTEFKNLKNIPEFLNNKTWGTYQLDGSYLNGDIYLNLNQDMNTPNLKRQYETAI